MTDQSSSDLGELEREVMQLIWGSEGMTAETIRDQHILQRLADRIEAQKTPK